MSNGFAILLQSDFENLPKKMNRMPNEQELRECQRSFSVLSLKELLKEAARIRNVISVEGICVHYAYRKNFGHKMVHFDVNSNEKRLIEYPDHILVAEHQTCQIFLQLFNQSISKILIMYDEADAESFGRYEFINRLLSAKCANGLESITFKCAQFMPITLRGFNAIFQKVQIIRMENVDLDDKFPELANLFPKVYRLEFHDVSMIDNGVRLEFLRDLEITYVDEHTCDRLNEVQSLLRLNSMLRNLRIVMPNVNDMNMEFLLELITQNGLLMKLIVKTGMINEPVREAQIHRLMRYFSLETLDLSSFRMMSEYAYFLWRTLTNLRTFTTRIVKYMSATQDNRLVTRFRSTGTGTGYEILAPIARIRTMPRDDPVTFRRS